MSVLPICSSQLFSREFALELVDEARQAPDHDERCDTDEDELELVEEADLAALLGAEEPVRNIGEMGEEDPGIAARNQKEEEQVLPRSTM